MTARSSDIAIEELPRNAAGLATTAGALTHLQEQLPAFLEELVTNAGAERLIVQLDGGVETTVAATLAVEALGPERVTGLLLPAFMSHEATMRNAEAIATSLGIEADRIHLQPVLAAFQEAIGGSSGPTDDLVATNNALSRLRMACAYYVANTANGLVVGTVNRTEYLLGSLTKHGEIGADCLLLGDLYRTEVRALADAIGIPENITVESSTPSFQGEGSHSGELDAPTETIDRVLRLHVDEGVGMTATAERVGVDPALVDRIAQWCARTEHKRRLPPTPGIVE
ncbi:NAD(+) synthase [Natrinema sp. H-ect4]|uniref:NAD(+) synthase n=1 Tax=Natrinema sp. H-ect4 TaxID=3242699 RepID=UPI0035A8373B